MNYHRFWPHLPSTRFLSSMHVSRIFTLAVLLLILIFSTFAISQPAFAQQTFSHALETAQDGPSIGQVDIGFDSRFRDGNWAPVRVTLDNNGSDFQGTISVNVPSSMFTGGGTTSAYRISVSLPSGAHKVVTLYAPFTFGTPGNVQNIRVDLLNTSGQVVSRYIGSLRTLNSSDLFVGVLSDQNTGFTALSSVAFAGSAASIFTQPLNAATFPANSVILRNFDLIVLDNFTTSSLSQPQLDALRNWVDQGGSLLVAGGPEWARTFKALPSGLVPATPNGTSTLTGTIPLLPPGAEASNGTQKVSDSIASPLPVSTVSSTSGATDLAFGTTPLITQQRYGQGNVVYLAFDPSLDPISSWSGASALWKSLLFRTVNEQTLMSTQNSATVNVPVGAKSAFTSKPAYLDFTGLLQSLLPNTVPAIVFILVLLLAYILILGPIRMILVRFLKKRDWSWRITLITIVVFSLLSYGLAIKQQGTSIVSDSVSIVQLSSQSNTTTTAAHITTFQGVFVPNQGDYNVHIPQGSLVQPNNATNGPVQASSTTIALSTSATDVTLQGVDIWTLRSIVSERDQALHGGIVSHLSIINGNLQGTVTNTLPYDLSNAYVLIGNQYLSVGNIASGASTQVQLQLNSSYDPTGNQSIINQLENANGQPGNNYAPYNGQQLTNDTQRHLAVLNALSGYGGNYTYCVNGTCYQNATLYPRQVPAIPYTVKSGMSIASGGIPYLQYNEYDPLSIAGAPATLIAWADNSTSAQSDILGNVTINGNAATGHQEILIQAPLNATYSGSLHLSAAILHGRLVDAQGTSSFPQGGNAYTMNAGSITYEYTALDLTQFQAAALSITEDANLNKNGVPITNNGTQADANSLKVQVYNWHKHTWDNYAFTQFSLSINSAQSYIGPNGQILIQLSNSDTSKTIVFNKPLLSLQGSI